MRARTSLFVALLALVVGCSSGSSPTCDNSQGKALATGSWPEARHDSYNTGRTDADLQNNDGTLKWVFPTSGAKSTFATTPAITSDGARIYIGSADGTLYALSTTDGTPDPGFSNAFTMAFPNDTAAPIFGSPAIDSDGKVYFSTNLTLELLDPNNLTVDLNNSNNGTTFQFHTFPIGGLGASPILATDGTRNGTVFAGAASSASTGSLAAVCANNISRWTFVGDPVVAPPAVGPDGTVYFGSFSSQRPYARALDPSNAKVHWTFAASQPIGIAPLLEVSPDTNKAVKLYIATVAGSAQGAGRLFAIDATNGMRIQTPPGCDATQGCSGTLCCKPFSFGVSTGASIRASPAFDYPVDGAVQTIYVAATDGRLYAVDADTGTARAVFETAGAALSPPLGIRSSPAVAQDNGKTTVVFGSDDGHVYRVVDDGDSFSEAWSFELPSSDGPVTVGVASPAIGSDGTVYIGTEDGHVYAIGGTP